MSVLIDTHILLWAAGIEGNLPDKAADVLKDPDVKTFVSAVTAWEIAIKWSKGRLTLPEAVLRENRLLNLSGVLCPKPKGYRSKGIEALREMRLLARQKQFGRSLTLAPRACVYCGDIFAYAWRHLRAASGPRPRDTSRSWAPRATSAWTRRTSIPSPSRGT